MRCIRVYDDEGGEINCRERIFYFFYFSHFIRRLGACVSFSVYIYIIYTHYTADRGRSNRKTLRERTVYSRDGMRLDRFSLSAPLCCRHTHTRMTDACVRVSVYACACFFFVVLFRLRARSPVQCTQCSKKFGNQIRSGNATHEFILYVRNKGEGRCSHFFSFKTQTDTMTRHRLIAHDILCTRLDLACYRITFRIECDSRTRPVGNMYLNRSNVTAQLSWNVMRLDTNKRDR